MKKCSRKLLLIILLLQMQFASIGVSFADQSSTETVNKPIAEVIVSDDMLRVLSEKIDDIFPITVQKEFFDQPAQDLYSDVGRETMVRIGTDEGVQNIILFVNQDGIHEYTGGVDISGSYQTNFMATMNYHPHAVRQLLWKWYSAPVDRCYC